MSPEQKKAYELLEYKTARTNPSADQFFAEGGSFPSPSRDYKFVDYIKVPDPHPWIDDLRSLAKMLSGEIEIPHMIINHSAFPDPITGERTTTVFPSNNCPACREAFKLRVKYQESLLSKET